MAIINPYTQSRPAPYTTAPFEAIDLNTATPAQKLEYDKLRGLGEVVNLNTATPAEKAEYNMLTGVQNQTQAPVPSSTSNGVRIGGTLYPSQEWYDANVAKQAPVQNRTLSTQQAPQPTGPVDFRTPEYSLGATDTQTPDGRTSAFQNGIGASTLGTTPQDNILQNIFDTIQEQNVSQNTILGKYSERQAEAKKATEAAQSLIEQQFKDSEAEARKLGRQEVTSVEESRRGFATNSAVLRDIEEKGAKRIKDLESQRDQKLAMNDALGAERIDNLLFEEQNAITQARVQSLQNMFNLLGAAQSVASFETPAQTREANLQNALTLFANQQAIGQQFDDKQTIDGLKMQYANVEGIENANNLAEIIGFIGPQIAEDRNLQQQLLQAQIASQQASAQNAINSVGTRELPASNIVNLSDAQFLPGVLDELETLVSDNIELFNPISGRIPFSEERNLIEDDLRRAAQLVGKFMEGGVLRKEDEVKYAKMLPKLTDLNATVALNKLEGVRDMLSMKYNGYLTDFANSGFDVSGFQPISFKKGNFTTTIQGQTYQFSSQEDLDSFKAQVGQ